MRARGRLAVSARFAVLFVMALRYRGFKYGENGQPLRGRMRFELCPPSSEAKLASEWRFFSRRSLRGLALPDFS